MSTLADRLEKLASPGPRGSDTRDMNIPESWRPRMEIDSNGGFLISTPRNAGEIPNAVEILAEFDLDPQSWKVTGLRRSRWQTYSGEWLEACRVSLAPAEVYEASDLDAQALIEEISKWKPGKVEKFKTGDLAYLFVPSDQQIGKKTGREGTGH